MFIRRDLTNAKLKLAEDRGVNEKEWIIEPNTQRDALFKATQIKEDGTSTYADYAESIVADICALLDVPCAEIELVVRNGVEGCLSYSFLNEGEELIDIAAVIQNAGRNFDSKRMIDSDTKEGYSIEMILEGLESLCDNKKDFNRLRREFLEQVLVDAIVDQYDRNPSNLSIKRRVEEPENIGIMRTSTHMQIAVTHMSEKYDNGTALSISVPAEAIESNMHSPKEFRQKVYSKIGYLFGNYKKYPGLESFIFNYHYEAVDDFVSRVQEKLTDDAIQAILTQEKYDGLPDLYKEMITIKLTHNRDEMLERFRKISRKKIIDKVIAKKEASERFDTKVDRGDVLYILPDYEECIGRTDPNPDYDMTLDREVSEKMQNITDIFPLARYLEIPIQPLSSREMMLLKWNAIIENMQKANPDKNIFEDVSDSCGFLPEDIEVMNSITSNRFIDEHDLLEVRNIIYGENGVGESNINLYICKKFVDATVMRKDIREQRLSELRTFIATIKQVVELEHIINDGKLSVKSREIMNLGNTPEQTIAILYTVAERFRDNPRITWKEQRALVESMTNDNLGTGGEKIQLDNGAYIDKELYDTICSKIVTLADGSKITFADNDKKTKDLAFKIGSDYVCQIVEAPNGSGVTMSFITAKGQKMPESMIEYMHELERSLEAKYGVPEKPYIKSFITGGNKASQFFSVASPIDERIKIDEVTPEKMRQIIIDRCNQPQKLKTIVEE